MWALMDWLEEKFDAVKKSLSGAVEESRESREILTGAVNTRATPANVTAAQTAIVNHINTRTVADGQPGVVRSVQRGTARIAAGGADINIAGVTGARSITLISGGNQNATVVSSMLPRAALLAGRIAVTTATNVGESTINWQVIEFF